jgi:hypothetical protein
MNEEILGLFLAEMDRGFFKATWGCQLAFTEKRLIVAKHKGAKLKAMISSSPYVFHQANASERAKMKSVSAESLLQADSENFEIPYSNINAIDCLRGNTKRGVRLQIFTISLEKPAYEFHPFLLESYEGEMKGFLSKFIPGKV